MFQSDKSDKSYKAYESRLHWFRDCPFLTQDEIFRHEKYPLSELPLAADEVEYRELCQYCLAGSNRRRINGTVH